ncbi:TPA: DUF4752 family protein [Enterobacter kobei]|nr:DUF4752 family protein [Enterobacter kobei]HDC4336707.1 DUF4752 family protein [Enterobacter kobei]
MRPPCGREVSLRKPSARPGPQLRSGNACAGSWVIGILIRRGWRLWNRKDEKTLAMDSFYEAFRLADIEPGQRVVITTESGMQIHILRPKGDRHA